MTPLWRAAQPDYDGFAEVLGRCGETPVYLPWPLSPGWRVADYGCVGDPGTGSGALATVTTTCGTSSLDGDVEVTIAVEEPGVGLGARLAGTGTADPGATVGLGAAAVRIRVDQRPVPLWAVPSGESDDVLARSVFAGEAGGRWLWLVMRPASAALLLRDEWLFSDAATFGPQAVEIGFGGRPASW
ncbi:hypothetical protein D9V37_02560 [Nocardioides mangrovicus]|uniref:Uncharacterized protein n=1 Tax=Nocardioides mangrovicus TaxID=2478913 RepID=A0A3L8P7D9_9ACTN|nr:hypothetical protein D9V37_02560 [Nocardioides mangrovicus]